MDRVVPGHFRGLRLNFRGLLEHTWAAKLASISSPSQTTRVLLKLSYSAFRDALTPGWEDLSLRVAVSTYVVH